MEYYRPIRVYFRQWFVRFIIIATGFLTPATFSIGSMQHFCVVKQLDMKGWITWGDLLIYLVAGTAIYYAYVLLVYFRRQFKKHAQDERPVTWKREVVEETKGQSMPVESVSSPVTSSVHELMNELKEVFDAAVQDQLHKEQVLDAVHIKLNKYPAVGASHFREAIHQHIISELSLQRQMTISPAEVNSLW